MYHCSMKRGDLNIIKENIISTVSSFSHDCPHFPSFVKTDEFICISICSIEEGFLQKRRQRLLLLFEGQNSFNSLLAVMHQDDKKKRIIHPIPQTILVQIASAAWN